MIKLSRINQKSLYFKDDNTDNVIWKPGVTSLIVGDTFETIANAIFKSKIISTGIFDKDFKPDLKGYNTIFEVKATNDNKGKVCFRSAQLDNYRKYYDKWNGTGMNVIYLIFIYDCKKTLNSFHKELDVIQYLCNNICGLYILDHYFFTGFWDSISELHHPYKWNNDIGKYVKVKDWKENFPTKQSEFFVHSFKIEEINIKGFPAYTLCSKKIEKRIGNDIIEDFRVPEYDEQEMINYGEELEQYIVDYNDIPF